MKKILVLAQFVAIGFASFAQKATSGDFTLETQLNFQTGTAPISLFTPNIRARYFLSDDLAARAQFAFISSSDKTEDAENQDGTGKVGTRTQKSSTFTFKPGIEKHFAGTSKFSPYVGAELNFVFNSASEEWDNYDPSVGFSNGTKATITGAHDGFDGQNYNGPRGSRTFGFNLIAGADYYFTEAIYLGGEFTWGYAMTSQRDVEVEVGSQKSKALGGSESGFALFTTGIRLGMKF